MEWFAMSAKYYIDLEDSGVSERAEVFLTRACAYMADNETGGFLPKTALKRINLSTISRRIDELSKAGVMVERTDKTGWDFPAWFKWNAPLERQVKKRKADRDRVREKRSTGENVARQSGDVSRDVASPHNSTKQRTTTYVEESSHVSNAGADDERPAGPAIDVDGWKLVRDAIPANHPQATKTALALEAGILLKAGTPAEDIAAALELWLAKPNLGPRTLPSLVSEVIRNRDRRTPVGGTVTALSTADQRVAQAQALKNAPGITWPGGPLELT
ncbi:hypothetical protein ACFWDA_24545 [Rhodococcus zopfii]|uniref:hypothetical protein n=1 Tax=Rhodococcus zopfii TaxID=43772 RepID=UPI003661AD63